jgi:uncharacterized protein YlbG (UPF0298 family)
MIQHGLSPISNALICLKGLNEQPLAPLDVYMSNEDLLLKKDELDPISYESIILLELTKWFVMRHMEKAKEMADLGKESFKMKRMALFYVNFESLATLHDKLATLANWKRCKKSAISSITCAIIPNGTWSTNIIC